MKTKKLKHDEYKKQKEIYFFDSPLGWLEISLLDGKLYSLSKRKGFKKSSLNKPLSSQIKQLKKELTSYFKGHTVSFSIPLADRGTSFQKSVWRELQKIPYGQTATYSSVAFRLRKAKAFRAVGQSCGKNPFLIVVPCHRVTEKTGLGGFALGLKAKKLLLNLEKTHGV